MMGRALRVLIIEDVEDHALLIVRELQKGGFDPAFERVDTLQELEAAHPEAVGVGATVVLVRAGVAVGPPPPPATVRPDTLGLSAPPPRVNWRTTWPLALAVVVNVRATARLAPPAAAKMSKAVSTVAPPRESSRSIAR